MPDITFDDLVRIKNDNIAAAAASQDGVKTSGGGEGLLNNLTQENLMAMGSMALEILKQVKELKGGSVLATRSADDQTVSQQEVNKPMVDVDQIKQALTTVMTLKGDITVSSMISLLDENKEAVAMYLKDV